MIENISELMKNIEATSSETPVNLKQLKKNLRILSNYTYHSKIVDIKLIYTKLRGA